ncbi:MAG: ABC transporter permease [Candidatus Tectimicrobiota bacterium]|nr:MAG: ABC transporter permease [Candidatus Tectomicrobia bacterium]
MTTIRFYLPLFLSLVAWQAAVTAGLAPAEMVPAPLAVFEGLWRLLRGGELLRHVGVSMYRQLAGFMLAAVIGTALGIGMARLEGVRLVFEPLLKLLYPLPKSALIPLLILWFGIGHNSKIFAIFLGCLLPVVLSVYNGSRGIPRWLVWSAQSLGTRPYRLLWKVYFPATLPDLLSGLRIGLALSFTLLVSSEFLIARAGLGFLIQSVGEMGDYAAMFAAILVVALIGFAADRLFVRLMARALRWQEP